jgi:hypothetical protein
VQTLKYTFLVLGGLFLLFWFFDSPRMIGPSTGESCVAFVSRLQKEGALPPHEPNAPRRMMTESERADFELCADAVNSDREEYTGH